MTGRTFTLAALVLATGTATIGAAPQFEIRRPIPAIAAPKGIKPGPSFFEVKDEHVTVHKDILLGRSVTTIVSKTEQVVLTIDRLGIAVVTPSGRHAALLNRPEGISGVVKSLVGLQSIADATALLERQRFDPNSPEGRAFGLTKALLESVAGDREGTLEVAGWAHAPAVASGPKAVLATTGSDPGSCWDAYARDAIRTANSYIDCYNNTSWYNVIDRMGCALLYDVEAEGDWIWYMNCVGLPFPQVRMG